MITTVQAIEQTDVQLSAARRSNLFEMVESHPPVLDAHTIACRGLLIETLSQRQFEVFRLLGQAFSPGDVASMLGISNGTVQSHKNTICAKLAIHGTAELARIAARLGF